MSTLAFSDTLNSMIVLACYRYVENQRIDGILTIRKETVHFEADFPSRHREHIPLHRLLGVHTSEDEHQIQLLSDMGLSLFYPIDSPKDWLSSLFDCWTSNRYTFKSDEFSGVISHPQQIEELEFLAYLEGTWTVNGNKTPCAIQIQHNGFILFKRGETSVSIPISDIQATNCHKTWFQEHAILRLTTHDFVADFGGAHSTHMWAHLQTIQRGFYPYKVWTEAEGWLKGPTTWVVSSAGLLRFNPTKWLSGNNFDMEPILWEDIHSLDFGREQLTIVCGGKKRLLGDRGSTSLYRGIVEKMLELICHKDSVIGFWKDDRTVDIANIEMNDGRIDFISRSGEESSQQIEEMWMPEIHDSTSAFLQLRVASPEPTPRWIILHCGTSDWAQEWVIRLNVPSRRLSWSQISPQVREGLVDGRPAKCRIKEMPDIEATLCWTANQLSIQNPSEELPFNTPFDIYFDDGKQQFRIQTTVKQKQDIPIEQWNLSTPNTLDLYNLRAYHRLPTFWDVQVFPILWSENGWRVDLDQGLIGHMVDISVAGCAIECPEEMKSSNIWLVQVEAGDYTQQVLCLQQNSHPLTASDKWRTGFKFAHPHAKPLQALWRELQKDLRENTEVES